MYEWGMRLMMSTAAGFCIAIVGWMVLDRVLLWMGYPKIHSFLVRLRRLLLHRRSSNGKEPVPSSGAEDTAVTDLGWVNRAGSQEVVVHVPIPGSQASRDYLWRPLPAIVALYDTNHKVVALVTNLRRIPNSAVPALGQALGQALALQWVGTATSPSTALPAILSADFADLATAVSAVPPLTPSASLSNPVHSSTLPPSVHYFRVLEDTLLLQAASPSSTELEGAPPPIRRLLLEGIEVALETLTNEHSPSSPSI